MPFTYNIDQDLHKAELVGYHHISRKDVFETFTALFFDPAWKNGFSIIVDLDQADLSEFNMRDLETLISHQERCHHRYKNSKVAVIARNDQEYGIARTWEMMGAYEMMTVMIFRNRDDAVVWLGNKTPWEKYG
jgi:hypothetical protein